MDFLIEILLDLISEGVMEGAKSKGVPKSVRYVLFGIIFVFFLCMMVLFIYLGRMVDGSILVEALFFGLAFMLAVFLIRFSKNFLLSIREKKSERETINK